MQSILPSPQRPAPHVIWITGAGRSGTHLTGMLADGHPQVTAFPVELRIAEAWGRLCAEASPDGIRIPEALADRYLVSRYLLRPEVGPRLPCDPDAFSRSTTGDLVTLADYLQRLARRLDPGVGRTFLFHCPGCQLGPLLDRGSQTDARVQVVLMLRHPVQNYLAWVEHSLQKGLGYTPADRVRRDLGLHSILHQAMFRVLRAFAAARVWQEDARVTVTRLEDFTGNEEARRRLWQALSIPFDPVLETTSRGGRVSEAHSGKWRRTEVQPVTFDLYDPVLAAEEARVLESCEPLFRAFYPDALEGVRVSGRGTSEDLLRERERRCYRENLEARAKRRQRMADAWGKVPPGWKGRIQWPARALYTAFADGPLYPELHLLRHRGGVRGALRGLEDLPLLLGIEPSGRDPGTVAGDGV